MAKYAVDLLSERQWALLLETYADRQRLMITNEDMGERRFQVLMTVVGAVGIALGLVADRFDDASLRATALLMALLLTALGYTTTVRMAHRNVATSRLKAELQIREFVAQGRPDLAAVLPYMTEKPAGMRTRPHYPSGGLVDLVALVTAAFAGLAVGALLGGRVGNAVTIGVALAAATLAWLGMILVVRRVYWTAQILTGMDSPRLSESGVGPTGSDGVRTPPRVGSHFGPTWASWCTTIETASLCWSAATSRGPGSSLRVASNRARSAEAALRETHEEYRADAGKREYRARSWPMVDL